jgi:hypothetical protein
MRPSRRRGSRSRSACVAVARSLSGTGMQKNSDSLSRGTMRGSSPPLPQSWLAKSPRTRFRRSPGRSRRESDFSAEGQNSRRRSDGRSGRPAERTERPLRNLAGVSSRPNRRTPRSVCSTGTQYGVPSKEKEQDHQSWPERVVRRFVLPSFWGRFLGWLASFLGRPPSTHSFRRGFSLRSAKGAAMSWQRRARELPRQQRRRNSSAVATSQRLVHHGAWPRHHPSMRDSLIEFVTLRNQQSDNVVC